jgi:beta-lactamase regulating signal transducer with metallopeptidase domain
MNTVIDTLNVGGEQALAFAGTMLWQSSLLIALVFMADRLLRRRARASIRYALWLVVLVKLVLPPSLALPTGLAWWLRTGDQAPAPASTKALLVTYPQDLPPVPAPARSTTPPSPPVPTLSAAAWGLAGLAAMGGLLSSWLLLRWRQVAKLVCAAMPPSASMEQLLAEAKDRAGLRRSVRLRLTRGGMSPAVCGLFRPVILLPESLVENLPATQLRAVLLHELIHLRRGDVWVNCAQALLQVVYWWHPLLWYANGRIRGVREEAVDDAVMLALREEADVYAPTLLEVARLAFHRPLASLGLVGILESRSALRQRIERLVHFNTPRRAGLSVLSVLGVAAFTAVAVPMGEAPAPAREPSAATPAANTLAPRADALVQEARTLYEQGKLDEADARLQQALALEPGNAAAGYYSRLIAQTRSQPGVGQEIQSNSLPVPNWRTRTNLVYTSAGRRLIVNKLDRIHVPSVQYDNVSLGDVLRDMREKARDLDADKRGINFLFNPGVPSPSGIDPATGLPVPASPGPETVDIHAVFIRVEPGLTNARLADVLDAIVEGASQPIKYSIEDYGVVFSARPAGPELFIRVFKVDPNTLYQALESIGAFPDRKAQSSEATIQTDTAGAGQVIAGHSNSPGAVLAAMKTFFTSLGVDLSPPKSLFFNDRAGTIFARGTKQDLDTIEAALETLNTQPPQVNISVRFVELNPADSRAAGVVENVKDLLQDLAAVHTNPPVPSTQLLTGILTDPQFRAVLKALQQAGPDVLLDQGEVTTLSGRQAQIQMGVELKTIVNGLTTTVTNGQTNFVYQTEQMPFGPMLDIVPTVSADGYTITMTVIPKITEFLGYDNPGELRTGDEHLLHAQLPLPRFRVRQMTTSAIVWDGQTLVLGNFSDQLLTREPDGRMETKPYAGAAKKQLFVFITPTIIDPAGNRVHTEDELPFTHSGTPPQKPQ